MSTGRYLSLEEARKEKQLDRFAKEHQSKGDEEEFDQLLGAMAAPKKEEKTPDQ